MKRVKVMIETDEETIKKVKYWLNMESDYAELIQTAAEVVEEMFFLDNGTRTAKDLRDKVKVTAVDL